MNKHLIDQVVEKMKSISSAEPLVVRAPGRINLIGEHTDYNNGFVLPAAVDLSIYFAITKSGSNKCNVYSLDLDESFDFEIDKELVPQSVTWANYIIGVISELKKLDASLEGFNLVFGGDVPQGSGMSSSAALECGLCLGMNELFDLGLDREQMAKVSQAAEHNYVGVKCGIMDQFSSSVGEPGTALFLDTKTMAYEAAPELAGYRFVVIESGVRHSLTNSGYAERVDECKSACGALGVSSLRDVEDEAQLTALTSPLRLRALHVLIDNRLAQEGLEALQSGDARTFGALMEASHASARDNYDITVPETDAIAA
ncbi:MAG: galactokinase, partial [Bacteroidota bacterium]